MLDRVDQKRPAVLPDDAASVVGVAFAVHSLAKARLAQQLHRSWLEDPGADASQHMRLRLPLEHDAVDSAEVKQVRQEHARGSAADNRHLSALHAVLPRDRTMHRDARRGLEHDAVGLNNPVADAKRREEGKLDDPLRVGVLSKTRENAKFRLHLPYYALVTGRVAAAPLLSPHQQQSLFQQISPHR